MVLGGQEPNVQEVRALYLEAIDSARGTDALVEVLEDLDLSDNPLLLGYLGSGHAMQAKHAFNPYVKYQLFTTGKGQLEAAIAADPDNAELRFLRFTVQENAPGFLGYNNDLAADKATMIDFLMETEPNTGIFNHACYVTGIRCHNARGERPVVRFYPSNAGRRNRLNDE